MKFFGVRGGISVADVLGDLDLGIQSSYDATIGKIKSASVAVQGGGDVSIAEVNGSLNVSVQGSGDVSVKGGEVDMVTCAVQGSGNISFKGRAHSASLSVMGSGDIDLKYVVMRPDISCLGSGDITVANWSL